MRTGLPTGAVTFMFTDIEGSTSLLHELGAEAFAGALREHRDIVRAAIARYGGVEVDTQGDAFFVAFPAARGAVAAAVETQAAIAEAGKLRIRMGLHTGTPLVTDEGYVGPDVHLGARVASAGHGGQVLLSQTTRQEVADAAEITDLGEHRLKDFPTPVSIYQIGVDVFPPLKTLSTTNLPRPANSFVGRSEQLKDVLGLLRDGNARLLSLTGPGGSGKTRLALEVATELVGAVKAGVFWVGLAALRDPQLVLPTVAQTIGAKTDVADYIGDREMVVLIDNLEHLLDAAVSLADLAERCPNLTLLVTSRERLRVRGETEYAVPPLAEAEAVELFCARSHRQPDDDVFELCRRLDNLPLAVELAAARASVLTPRQILDRIGQRLDLLRGVRGADDRQQTLRATIDWSHELLNLEEQRLLARFSVFIGGADLDAAEIVAGADLDVLQSLVDKSLLRATDGRFGMLEMIREYAAERLETAGEADQVRRAHAEHYLTLAEAAYPTTISISPAPALEQLETEHDNLRGALDLFEQSGDFQTALRMASAMWEFWCLCTHYFEGYSRVERLLSLDPTPSPARANALTASVHLATGAAVDSQHCFQRATEALELQRIFGSPWDVVFAEYQYGLLVASDGDFASALELMERVVERWRDVGDEHRELQAMRILAWACNELGDADRHRRLHEEILRRARLIDDLEPQLWSLAALADDLSRKGLIAEAVDHLRQSYEVGLGMLEPSTIDTTIVRVGVVMARGERFTVAACAFGLAERYNEQNDFAYPSWFAAPREEAITRARAILGESAFEAAWQRGKSMTVEDVFRLAHDEVSASVDP